MLLPIQIVVNEHSQVAHKNFNLLLLFIINFCHPFYKLKDFRGLYEIL